MVAFSGTSENVLLSNPDEKTHPLLFIFVVPVVRSTVKARRTTEHFKVTVEDAAVRFWKITEAR